ncbi:MAG: ligase-associated DNA damage response endonuclease PdeM [Pseudomonadota bacterium]
MNLFEFSLADERLCALGSGALWLSDHRTICVSDLHFGKSGRVARRTGANLPPYETRDTLDRLARDLDTTQARTVICLGDSFDDLDAAADLPQADRLWITSLQAGRTWIWVEGNHDPGPVDLGGSHMAEIKCGRLTFRHIAEPDHVAEVSGHYHPKARVRLRGRSITRAAFLADRNRVILPAYGTYTGGLFSSAAELSGLMGPDALAILLGTPPRAVQMPR